MEHRATHDGIQVKCHEQDLDLKVLTEQLSNLEQKFKKSHEEIAEIYVNTSGDMKKMRDHLMGKKVILWNYLEDLALQKADDSPEFAVLLQEKGLVEILSRRSFLKFNPQYAPE